MKCFWSWLIHTHTPKTMLIIVDKTLCTVYSTWMFWNVYLNIEQHRMKTLLKLREAFSCFGRNSRGSRWASYPSKDAFAMYSSVRNRRPPTIFCSKYANQDILIATSTPLINFLSQEDIVPTRPRIVRWDILPTVCCFQRMFAWLRASFHIIRSVM